MPEPLPGQSSIEDVLDEDVLDRPAADFGITPLDMDARAGAEKERVSRVLREFDGSGSAVLPMTIKLASQVAGLVSPLTDESSVPDERLHEAAFTAARTVRTLTYVLAQLKTRLDGENGVELRSNLQDTVDELDRLLAGAEANR
ncbi:hypothetical protein [Citricoccus nitrophenolicus]|uniref:hypothetical protein n=1 Tax=Citricoccus nitrophenolicus TaxID=863575 RepID=UPI0039B43697